MLCTKRSPSKENHEMGNLFRDIFEIGFGLLYLIGAIFNGLYTMSHGEEFYGSFANQALLAPSRHLIRKVVVPHARLFTGLLIAFQMLAAASILSRGDLVEFGLLVGAVFCSMAALVSNTPGAVINLLMGGIQLFLAFTR
jgi:hypothetical protein